MDIKKKLNILKISHLSALQEYKFCYNYYHNRLPHYFLNNMKKFEMRKRTYFTRRSKDIILPAPKYDFARHCILPTMLSVIFQIVVCSP